MIKNVLIKLGSVRIALAAGAGIPFLFAFNVFAQNPAPPPPGEATTAAAGNEAVAERVIVTGSNIPTAEETGPNPVDTYRPQDIEKLGVRNTTDLLNKLPQEAGGTINQNIANGGDGSVVVNLRGLLSKETLVLLDGKRVAGTGLTGGLINIDLTPFPMIDHIDILKDGASAVYGSDAVAGVFNVFLIHKFRGLEIGGSVGNTNLGSSNEAHEYEAWIKAGTGDDKTDIVVIADFYDKGAIFSRDRYLTSNAELGVPFGGFDNRSGSFPGKVGSRRLIPSLFFSDSSGPPPHSAPNQNTSPFYVSAGVATSPNSNFTAFNFSAFVPAIPAADHQSFYGSFTRDLCDKYLTVFGDFKYTRSFFDAMLAPVPFIPDAFKNAAGGPFSSAGISVPLTNPFNPFTVADGTLPNGTPVTENVRFRGINDQGNRTTPSTFQDMLFDVGLRGELGEFGDYFKNWNWELGFRYSRDEEEIVSQGEVSKPGLRDALSDTNPLTAFDPFGGFFHRNTQAAINRVYVTLHNSGYFELPEWYGTINGDIFNIPGGPISFALGGDYHGERWTNNPDSLNTTFNTIGSTDLVGSRVNRDVKAIYEELRIPVTSPTWNFPGAYSLEFDIAEREEWYSQNTTNQLNGEKFSTTANTQKPKFSVRWEPLDPKWIGALTLRGTYSEAFHAPQLGELSPAGAEAFPLVHDPRNLTPENQIDEIISGNPLLQNETAYEWSYGAVYSPKWVKGLTLSADFYHIDLRNLATILGAQFLIDHESAFPGDVIRDSSGAIVQVFDRTVNVSEIIVEGLDYEAIYILDSSIFGHGDFGRFTFTLNGTYLSRFEFQGVAGTKAYNLAGQYLPTSFTLTGSLPHNRAFVSAFYDGPADTWLGGFDFGATVHWTGQYEDDNLDLVSNSRPQTPRTDHLTGLTGPKARKIAAWTTLDLIASYTFNLPPPAPAEVPGFAKDGGKNVKMKDGKEKNVMPVSTAEYNPCGWRAWLNQTTVTLGMQNVLDEDPPFAAASFENNYDESLADVRGRFWYVQLKKRF
jgi:iron complex outermembrane receptor protein